MPIKECIKTENWKFETEDSACIPDNLFNLMKYIYCEPELQSALNVIGQKNARNSGSKIEQIYLVFILISFYLNF